MSKQGYIAVNTFDRDCGSAMGTVVGVGDTPSDVVEQAQWYADDVGSRAVLQHVAVVRVYDVTQYNPFRADNYYPSIVDEVCGYAAEMGG